MVYQVLPTPSVSDPNQQNIGGLLVAGTVQLRCIGSSIGVVYNYK